MLVIKTLELKLFTDFSGFFGWFSKFRKKITCRVILIPIVKIFESNWFSRLIVIWVRTNILIEIGRIRIWEKCRKEKNINSISTFLSFLIATQCHWDQWTDWLVGWLIDWFNYWVTYWLIGVFTEKWGENKKIKIRRKSRSLHLNLQWTRVNSNSNWTKPWCRPQWCAASTDSTLSFAGSVSTLMARPDFLQYPVPGLS